MIPFLDLTRQHHELRAELLSAVARVLDSSRFVLGAEGQALEAELARLAGVRHGVGVGSGTDALRLALAALGILPEQRLLGHGARIVHHGADAELGEPRGQRVAARVTHGE